MKESVLFDYENDDEEATNLRERVLHFRRKYGTSYYVTPHVMSRDITGCASRKREIIYLIFFLFIHIFLFYIDTFERERRETQNPYRQLFLA